MRIAPSLAALAIAGVPGDARAEDARVVWPEENPRFSSLEYGITSALLLLNVFNESLIRDVHPEVWHGGILTDGLIDGLATKLPKDPVHGFTKLGDYTMYGLLLFPYLVDAVITAGIIRKSPDSGWQIAMVTTQSLLASSLLNVIAKRWIPRSRPGVPKCNGQPKCPDGGAIHSFYSGHGAQAFAAAGAICAIHVHLKLFGDRVADAATCGAGLGLATAVSISRVLNRSHYASDVAIGSVVGLALGWALPVLLHYHTGLVTPSAQGDGVGLSFVTTF